MKSTVNSSALRNFSALILISMIAMQSAMFLDFSSKDAVMSSENDTLAENPIGSPVLRDAAWVYDDQVHQYIFLFDDAIEVLNNATILDNFTVAGGLFGQGPWKSFNGFSGSINNSVEDLGDFLGNITEVQVLEDGNIQAQMNTVHQQLQTYPAVIDSTGYDLQGDSNASVAFLDSGIDDTHVFFNETYDELNWSRTIIGWEDTIGGTSTPTDDNGHGTQIAAITVGGGDSSLSVNHTGDLYYMSTGGNYSHYDLFYPKWSPSR